MMHDPRRCDGCRQDAEHFDLAHAIELDPDSGSTDNHGRFCPGCAAHLWRRALSGPDERIALKSARDLLEGHFGGPLRLGLLRHDGRTWLILCRRRPLRAGDLRRDPVPGIESNAHPTRRHRPWA